MPDLNPELIAALQAQGYLDPNSPGARVNPFQLPGAQRDAAMARANEQLPPPPQAAAPPPAAPNAPGNAAPPSAPMATGALNPTEQMLSSKLIAAGVPTTVPQSANTQMKMGANAPKVEGIFENKPEGEKAPPAWKPSFSQTAVPGGWKSTVSEPVRGEYENAMQRLAGAPEQQAIVQGEANEHTAKMYESQAAQLGELMMHQQQARQERARKLDELGNDYRRLAEESANDKVDPQRWWGNKDTGSQIMGVIGILFSGFGKGPNQAMQMYDRMMTADIDAQKHDIAQKGKKAEAVHSLYAQKLKQFGDEDAADLATRAQMNEQFKLQAMSEALRTQSPALIAKAQELGAQVDLNNAKIHQGLEQWKNGGIIGGPTPEDQKRAFEMVKSGMVNPKTGAPLTPTEALQMAMAVRGAAPDPLHGIVKPGAGGKADKHDIAASELAESGQKPVEALGAWDRVTAGLSHIPGVGFAFAGTEGAKKERAQKASNVAPLGYMHAGVGIRNYEDMVHAGDPLLIKSTDTQEVINQKLALRALGGEGMKRAIDEARKHPGGSGGGEKDDEE